MVTGSFRTTPIAFPARAAFRETKRSILLVDRIVTPSTVAPDPLILIPEGSNFREQVQSQSRARPLGHSTAA
jgi:hypothetical protein